MANLSDLPRDAQACHNAYVLLFVYEQYELTIHGEPCATPEDAARHLAETCEQLPADLLASNLPLRFREPMRQVMDYASEWQGGKMPKHGLWARLTGKPRRPQADKAAFVAASDEVALMLGLSPGR